MKKEKHENQVLIDIISLLQKIKIINCIKYLVYLLDRFICLFIKKPKEEKSKKQILILANLGLGDAINFLSTVKRYRSLYPKEEYEITLYVSNHLDELFRQETEFDNIELVPFNQIATNIKQRIELTKKIRSKFYDKIIDTIGVSGCTSSVYLMASACANEKISIVDDKISICPQYFKKKIYTKLIRNIPEKYTNIEFYHFLLAELENSKEINIEFHQIKERKIEIDLPKEYYIVFPSTSLEIKKWECEKYAELIEKVFQKTKLPVIFCGTESDRKDVDKVIRNLKNAKYIDLLGKSSVLDFIEIIRRSKFVITNDTGAYHIAVNLEVPVAIITGGYTYDGFVTYDFKGNKYRKPYIIVDKRECFNCNNNCPYKKDNEEKWPCISAITVNYAWNIVEKMINDMKNGGEVS